MDKPFLYRQLAQQLRHAASVALRATEDAVEAAATMATDSEKKEDARAMMEFGSLATGQAARHRRAMEEVEALTRFAEQPVTTFARATPVGLGALVDVATCHEDGRREERSYILLPVGAGTELTGPDGDGFFSVITPQSPVGRMLMGRRVGERFDLQVRGQVHEWTITDVG
jgi:transcription elongation GreA/GreB family factor